MKLNILFGSLMITTSILAQSFTFNARGRTYTVTTAALPGSGFQFGGHWLYEPSVITPSSLTGYQYYLLFNSNLVDYDANRGQAIFLKKSTDGITFDSSRPQAVLQMAAPICDMIDARPIHDGTRWHVFVQARTNCSTGLNYVFEAVGLTLESLSWVTDAMGKPKPLLTPRLNTGVGIGEDIQAFQTGPYGGPGSIPMMLQYNDWGFTDVDYNYCPNCSANGTPIFSYLSDDAVNNWYFWYYREPASGWPYADSSHPDVILANSLDQATLGNPAIGFASKADCENNVQVARGLSFYPDPVPYPSRTPQGGMLIGGYVQSSVPGLIVSTRLARNEHGYLLPVSDSPKTWQTLLYYNSSVRDAYGNPYCPADIHRSWNTSYQRFSVSTVTITEQ